MSETSKLSQRLDRDEIIKRHPIVELLRARGHELNPSGGNFITNACPVTKHKQPHEPVMIYPHDQSWFCHDCEKGGSVIDWLMFEKRISAGEAMQILGGDRNGVVIKTHSYPDEKGKPLYVIDRFEPKDFKARMPNARRYGIKGVRRVLYNLPAVIEAQIVIVCEGEKNADDVNALGFVATTNPFGAGKWRDEFSEVLRGKDVVVFGDIGDEDKKGEKHTAQVLQSVNGKAASLKHAIQPDGFHDVSDWLASLPPSQRRQAITKLIDATPQFNPASLPASDDEAEATEGNRQSVQALLSSKLPKIQLPGDNRLLSQFADECGENLKRHGIYQRGGNTAIVNDARDGLEVITPAMLRTLVERYLVCYRIKGEGAKTAEFLKTMSVDDAQGVLSSKQFLAHLPKVDRIATTRLPIMREHGAIELLRNGYDAQSRTLTLAQCDYTTLMSLKDGRAVIDDLFSEFPFADAGRSKAIAITAMVSLYANALIDRKRQRPVFFYVANAEGAGKTLLARCAITPTHGEPKIDSALDDNAETKKELVAALIEARPYILFDNVKGHLNSSVLEGFATATRFSGRILGVSKMFVGENDMTVFITGNGCTITPDMRRRSLFSELLMEAERAEERSFKRELDQSVLIELRPQILAALWALVHAWDRAGRPSAKQTHGTFLEWSRIIGGIVEFAGYRCPFETAHITDAADTAGADMHELVQLLAQNEPMKFDELVELSQEHGLFEWIISGSGELKPAERSRFGKLLKRYDRRIFAQGRFIVDGRGRSKKYRVVPIA